MSKIVRALALVLFVAVPRVFAQEADLLLEKSAPAEAAPGDDVPYQITVTNLGPNAAANVVVTDNIPAGMTFVSTAEPPGVSCTAPAVGDSGTVTCSVATLNASASIQLTFTFNIPPTTPLGTTFTNFVTATTDTFDPNSENDVGIAVTTTTSGPQADLYVAKNGPAVTGPDTDVTYTIALGNGGTNDATNVTLQDTLPGDLTFVSLTQNDGPALNCTTPAIGAGGTVTCTVATFPASMVATFTLVARVPDATASGTSYTNSVNVTADNDPNEENDVATTTVTVSEVDLAIDKTGPATVIAGDDVTYTISITNSGPDTAIDVIVTDVLPAGATFVSLARSGPPANCTTPAVGDGGTVTCVSGAIFTQGAPLELTLVVNSGSATALTNTASVTSNESFDSNPANNQDDATTNVTPNADLTVVKTGPAVVNAGGSITYGITVTNGGISDASTVVLTDVLPAQTTFVSMTQTAGPTFNCSGTTTVTCTIATFAADASATFTLVADVNATASGTLENAAQISSATGDNDGSDNASSVTTLVNTTADLTVTKNAPATVAGGTNLTYTITVANAGPASAVNVSLTDALPAETTFVSLEQTGPAFTCTTPAAGANGTVTCNIAALNASTSTTFTLVVAVASNANGALNNTAIVTSTSPDPTTPNESSVQTAPSAQSDVSVTKSGPISDTAGTTITYTITASNAGPTDAANVVLRDTLPAGVTFESLTQENGQTFNCTLPAQGTNGSIVCMLGLFDVGSATFTLVVNAAPNLTGTLDNTVTISTDAADPDYTNNQTTESTPLTADANLSVAKSGPATVTAGTNVTYTVTIGNSGPSNAANVTLTDLVPAQTTFVSLNQTDGPTFNCNTPPTLTCTTATFAPGTTATLNLTFSVDPGATGTIDNTATVASSSDTTPENNSSTASTVVNTSAQLSVTKNGPPGVIAGNRVTYAISVANAGPSDAASVTLTDVLPAGTTFVSMTQNSGATAFNCTGTTTVTCTAASLPADQNASLTLVVDTESSATGTLTNTATVASSTADPIPGNNAATTSTTVTTSADLQITKSGPAAAIAGSNVTYTIVVANNGVSDAANVVLTDVLPAQATFFSMTQTAGPAFNCTGTTTVTCTISSLPADTNATFSLVATVSPTATGAISNTATVTSAAADFAPQNNASTVATTIGANADLIVTKTAPPTATQGAPLTYSVTVTNGGPSDAMNVVLTDALPAQTTFVSTTQTAGPTFTCTTPAAGANGTITCTIATLASGATATFSFVVSVDPAASGTIENTASVTSSTPDPTPGNSSGTAGSLIAPATTDLLITKTANGSTFPSGSTAVYTIVVTNNGPAFSTNTTVTDVLPAGTSFVSATSTQGTCTGMTTVTCSLGTLAPDADATITITVILPTASGQFVNTATVTSDQNDPAPANNQSTSTIAVVPVVAAGIPTLSPLAMIMLAMFMAGAAMLVMRSR